MNTESDTDLVVAALGGDRVALGRIYDRYSDDIYSFAMSRLRNRELAADATQETFLKAATRLSTLRRPERLRAWLFAIARNKIVDQVRAAQRSHTDVTENMMIDHAHPGAGLESVESADLLWDAAGSLTDRDRDLLELSVRHGLDGEDLADALGVGISHLHVLKSRMNDRLKKAVGALLVARVGADDCAQLAGLLKHWDGRYTIEVRSQVTRHVADCIRCDKKQTSIIGSGMAFGMLPLVPAPPALRGQTIDAMADAIANPGPVDSPPELQQPTTIDGNQASSGWRYDGFPTVAENVTRAAAVASKTTLAVLIGLLFLITGAIVGLLVFSAGGQDTAITSSAGEASVDPAAEPDTNAGGPASEASITTSTTTPAANDDESESSTTDTTTASSTTTTSTTTSSTTTSLTTTAAPGNLVVETSSVSFGLADTASILIINNGGSPATYNITVDSPFSVAVPTGAVDPGATETILVAVDRTGQPRGTLSGQATITTATSTLFSSLGALVDQKPSIGRFLTTDSIECGGFFSVTMTASDDDDITSVDVVWSGPGVKGSANLGDSKGSHSNEFGPIAASANGTITVVVTATDTAGQTTERSAEIPISNCP